MSCLVPPFTYQGKSYPGVRFVGPSESLPARPQGALWRKYILTGGLAGLVSYAAFDNIADDPGLANNSIIPNTADGKMLNSGSDRAAGQGSLQILSLQGVH